MKSPFLAALEQRVLLADGAMGTLLHSRGVAQHACLEALVLDSPDIVRRVHEDYIAAGADIIETDTFGANRFRLARHGLESRVRDINFKAARLARDAREIHGHPVFVAGAIGPTGRMLATAGDVRPGVSITIGGEHGDVRLDQFTVVTAEYHAGALTGVIGVIGPTRMSYEKVISLVSHTSSLVTELLDG